MTTRHAYRVTSTYCLILAALLGAVLVFAPATGIITTISLFGCFIASFLALYLFVASFSANPKHDLDGIAIQILLDHLLR